MGKQRTPEAWGSAREASVAMEPDAMADDPGREGRDGRLTRRAARTSLVLWMGALVVGTALFHAIGDGPLAAPPLDPSGWASWAEGRDPLIAVFAVLRLLVLALSWYLVGATSVGILARLLRAARLVRVADALTVPALRRVLQGALGVSLATAMVATSVTTGEISSEPYVRAASSVILRAAHDEVTAPAPAAAGPAAAFVAAGEGDRVTLEHVERGRPLSLELLDRARETEAAASDGSDTDAENGSGDNGSGDNDSGDNGSGDNDSGDNASADLEDVSGGDGAALPGAVDEHVVVAGESFWTIAEDVVRDQLERTASEAETAAYWERLVEVNRDRLVDHDNPDLIFPGQVLMIPSAESAAPGAG